MQPNWFNGYQIGVELILINGLLTFIGLYLISHKSGNKVPTAAKVLNKV